MDSCLAELSNASKRYGSTMALNGLNLQVRSRELLAVLGPNGAGKTTAISLLLGLQQPNGGSAHILGGPPRELAARRRIGVMMQEVTLVPELRVREHLDLLTRYYETPLTVTEALELTHAEALADRPYGTLSGGEKRLAQFALAVCGKPTLLFLDEPTVGLDVQAREAMWEVLRELIGQGASIVLTTHYIEEAESLADRVVVVAGGRSIAEGTVNEIRNLVVRTRISCVTSLAVEEVAAWPGVGSANRREGRLTISAANAESVVKRLLDSDEAVEQLEVVRAGLAEVFTELTNEAKP